jgi:hypothetical protein
VDANVDAFDADDLRRSRPHGQRRHFGALACRMDATQGDHHIEVRATDSSGYTQTDRAAARARRTTRLHSSDVIVADARRPRPSQPRSARSLSQT